MNWNRLVEFSLSYEKEVRLGLLKVEFNLWIVESQTSYVSEGDEEFGSLLCIWLIRVWFFCTF